MEPRPGTGHGCSARSPYQCTRRPPQSLWESSQNRTSTRTMGPGARQASPMCWVFRPLASGQLGDLEKAPTLSEPRSALMKEDRALQVCEG